MKPPSGAVVTEKMISFMVFPWVEAMLAAFLKPWECFVLEF
jgi:hypothetical protein